MLKTFYIDYDISIKDGLLEIINSYSGIKEYLMSHEEYNKQGEHKPHYHFFFKVDDIKTFNNCVKNILLTYNLKELGAQIREQTGKKGYRNYGVHKKKIYTPDYFMTYICKDKNVWGSYPKDEIQSYIDASFKSQTETEIKDKIYKYIKLNYLNDRFKDIINKYQLPAFKYKQTQIQLCIMEYFRENDMTITKTKITNHFNYFISKNSSFSIGDIFIIMDL